MAVILVVDDRAINREYLVTLLRYNKHETLEAGDGVAALEIIKEKNPDLVITDVMMPRMTGYELVQQLQLDRSLSKIPVIFYAATYRLEEAAVIAMKCGVKYVLTKPSEPQVILDMVKKALNEPAEAEETKPIAVDSEFQPATVNSKLSRNLVDIEDAKRVLKNLVRHTQDVISDREDLIKIAEKLTLNLNQLVNMSSRLYTLLEFHLDLFAERDMTKLAQLFTKGARQIVNSEYCVLGITGPNQTLQYSYIAGVKTPLKEFPIENIDTTFIKMIQNENEKPLKIDNLSNHPELRLPANHPPVNRLLGVPLNWNNHRYGYVYFTDKLDNTMFNDVDTEIILGLAYKLSVLYENMLLNKVLKINQMSSIP